MKELTSRSTGLKAYTQHVHVHLNPDSYRIAFRIISTYIDRGKIDNARKVEDFSHSGMSFYQFSYEQIAHMAEAISNALT